MSVLRVLSRHAPFRALWAGQSLSLLGTAVTEIAVPLTAAVYLEASPFEMGLLTACGYLPWLIIGLPAGAWVDAGSKRRTLILSDLVRFALLLAVPLAAWADVLHMSMLLVIVLCVGVCTVFYESAASATIPRLLPDDALIEGNSLIRLSHSVSFVAGPGLGGSLVGLLTAPVALVADALSYLASAFYMRKVPDEKPEPRDGTERRGMSSELSEGLGVLFGSKHLRAAVLSTAMLAMANGIFSPVYILFLTRDLDITPSLVAVPYMVFGAGSIAGSFLAGPVGRRFGFGPALVTAGIVNGLISLAIPLLGVRGLPLALIVAPWLFFGLIGPVYGSLVQTLIQSAAPKDMLGRISSSSNFVAWGCQAVAALIGGGLGSALGLRATLYVSCCVYLAAPVFLFCSPARRLRKPPPRPEAAPSQSTAAQ
ncbi:MFS transporter [Streptomyces sioyaensis]|uniref:MFS transporter n=1 Tax=Streptomyces sioyaensis TaxID=67364 RepID=UPI0037B835C6